MDRLEQARADIDRIDDEMAALFVRRMEACAAVAAYKREHGMAILDSTREGEVLRRGEARVNDPVLRPLYATLLKTEMELSKRYQRMLMQKTDGQDPHGVTTLHLDLAQNGYDVMIGRGILARAGELLALERRVLVVTDDGVPPAYAAAVAAQCAKPELVTLPMGEGSKSLATAQMLLERMLERGFTRTDCVVAVGGGVVGDLCGFVAASYMRGVDFYNIPTTLLSQVDSSVGGKVAVNLGGVKNSVGFFYQPKRVLIDPDVLLTLPKRQISSGLAEVVKMAMTSDADLFEFLEKGGFEASPEAVIAAALRIKMAVVREDERESGLRRVLNFGHTLGHGIEAVASPKLYHGECVALGMIPVCSDRVRERLLRLLQRLGLPTCTQLSPDEVLEKLTHDKKCDGDRLSVVWVEELGSFEIRKDSVSEWQRRFRAACAWGGESKQ